MRRLTWVFGPIALVLLAGVGIGVLLPGSWTATRTRIVGVPPDSVYRVLIRPPSWREWMPFPESGITTGGPESGEGSFFAWDDPVYGAGRFRILEADPARLVRYRVTVEGGIVIDGSLRLAPAPGGSTEIRWLESGEMGQNPILGYQALFMEEQQGEQLQRTLDRLSAVIEGENGPAPRDAPAQETPAQQGPTREGPAQRE